MKTTFVWALGALAALTACSGSKQTQEEPSTRSLIVYYSQTGATEQVAKLLQSKTGADMTRIETVVPYDGDFAATIARCQEEMRVDSLPALQPVGKQIADYDTLYLGYPVWFGIPAQPMNALLKQADLKGKVVIPFCTFGSGGNTSIAKIEEHLNGGTMPGWYGVRNARVSKADAELDAFLVSVGAKKGEVAARSEFGEQQPLTDEDRALYDAACGSYPMPLGTPVSVASRPIAGGMEYLFTNESQSAEGQTATSTLYIVKMEGEEAPEFTQVVR